MHTPRQPHSAPTEPRSAGLDGLRGIAILLVLYHHAPLLLRLDDAAPLWAGSRGGWIGVDLFFVLSGFLITGLLLKDRGTPGALGRFWIRRAFRIFPLAYTYLLVLALLAVGPGLQAYRDVGSFLCSVAYLENFHIVDQGWSDPSYAQLWSLCVEEHFYFLWPLAALWLSTASLRWLLIGAIALTPLVRWWLLPLHGSIGNYVNTVCRWDSLCFGALLALAWHSPWRPRVQSMARWMAAPALLALAAVLALGVEPASDSTPKWFHVIGFSVIALACTQICTIALAPPRGIAAVLCHPLLTRLGRISYGLYIWHVLLAQLTLRTSLELNVTPMVRVAVWLLSLLALATASYRWLELPLLRLRDRLPHRQREPRPGAVRPPEPAATA